MEKKPIVETLRRMRVGDVEHFPLTQYNSVRTSIYTSLLSERADGWAWDIRQDLKERIIVATRIS